MNYSGQFNAQELATWTSEWGGGSLPKAQHGRATITSALTGLSIHMTPGGPWDTFYQLQRLPPMPWSKQVVYHESYQVADSDIPACQALEGEIQKNDGSLILNGGFQFDFRKTKTFNTYDFLAGHWIPTDIPTDIALVADGKTLDVVVVYDLTPTTITWRGLQMNGIWISLGITRPGKSKVEKPYFNFANQWDFTKSVKVATMLNPCVDIVVT